MAEKKINWFKIADTDAMLPWQDNDMCMVEVDGKTVTLARFKEQLFAFAQKCPHAGGIMSDGYIDATGLIVCPIHRYRFNMQNGRNTSGEGYYLKTYQAERRADGIYIGLEERSFWSL